MTKLLNIAVFAVPACAMLAFAQQASAAGGAFAAAANAASTAAVQQNDSAAKRVCINVVLDTGSRMARRVCRTNAEWTEEGVDLAAKK